MVKVVVKYKTGYIQELKMDENTWLLYMWNVIEEDDAVEHYTKEQVNE